MPAALERPTVTLALGTGAEGREQRGSSLLNKEPPLGRLETQLRDASWKKRCRITAV